MVKQMKGIKEALKLMLANNDIDFGGAIIKSNKTFTDRVIENFKIFSALK